VACVPAPGRPGGEDKAAVRDFKEGRFARRKGGTIEQPMARITSGGNSSMSLA